MTIAMSVTQECRVCFKHLPPNRFPKGRKECKSCNSKRKMRERRRHPLKYAYKSQMDKAKRRGIEWHFTFDQWVEWWGDDIHKRGVLRDRLVMARYGDSGPYHPANVRKAFPRENNEESRLRR